ncbi:MAG: M23 family metallopeptidase [Alphaproteobacteria bacterium]|nr:M23 family metallopeptidase [Alphaproteobacteria bacterium]
MKQKKIREPTTGYYQEETRPSLISQPESKKADLTQTEDITKPSVAAKPVRHVRLPKNKNPSNRKTPRSREAAANENSERRKARLLMPLSPLENESSVEIRANWRWMLGSFLSGIAGLALISGAFHSTTRKTELQQGTLDFRDAKARFVSPTNHPFPFTISSRKADRGVMSKIGAAFKQIIEKGTVIQKNGMEFIQVRTHVNIIAGLITEKSEEIENLPPFEPIKLLYSSIDEEKYQPSMMTDDRDVVVTLSYLPIDGSEFQDTQHRLSYDKINSLVLEAVKTSHFGTPQAPIFSDKEKKSLFSAAFSRLFIPTAQHNVTALEPTRSKQHSNHIEEIKTTQKKEKISQKRNLKTILVESGATIKEAEAIISAMEPIYPTEKLKNGDVIRIEFTENSHDGHFYPVKISAFKKKGQHLATVGLVEYTPDSIYFTALDDVNALTDPGNQTQKIQETKKGISLYQSLFGTSRQNKIPDTIFKQIVRVHGYSIDFNREVQPGDSMNLLYVQGDEGGKSKPEVLYSAIKTRNEIKQFYRFYSENTGKVGYYDQNGKSSKLFLLRKPVTRNARMSSKFGMRRHPITHKRKLHTGVDWAARKGEPIVSAGDGIVEKAKWSTGYGYYTIIRHNNGYKTAYGHQSGFAKGIRTGVKVRQGQVIGYIGSTGNSTGSHLHYEVMVDGRFVDPLRIRVPNNLNESEFARFQDEMKRIGDMIKLAPTQELQLKRLSKNIVPPNIQKKQSIFQHKNGNT